MEKPFVVKFLIRSAIFVVVLFAVDHVVGYIFEKIYFHQQVGQFYQTTYAIDSASKEIMIFGSSRAVRHYSPAIITKATGLSCYDSGRDGLMIPYSTALEEVSLTRRRPKLIILDISPRELGIDRTKYERLTILLPYCHEHPQLIKFINEVSEFESLKLYSKTYPFNSSVFIMAHNVFFAKSVEKDDNGYLPLTGRMTDAQMKDYISRMTVRSVRTHKKTEIAEVKGVSYFREFLNNTAKNNIQTLVIISPTIINNTFYLDNQLLERELIGKITNEYPNVTLLDFSTDPRFNYHPEKFNDVFHLNKQGSAQFSAIVAAYIKKNCIKAIVNPVHTFASNRRF